MFFSRKNALLELNKMTNSVELKAKNPFALKTKLRARVSRGAVKFNLTSAFYPKKVSLWPIFLEHLIFEQYSLAKSRSHQN